MEFEKKQNKENGGMFNKISLWIFKGENRQGKNLGEIYEKYIMIKY